MVSITYKALFVCQEATAMESDVSKIKKNGVAVECKPVFSLEELSDELQNVSFDVAVVCYPLAWATLDEVIGAVGLHIGYLPVVVAETHEDEALPHIDKNLVADCISLRELKWLPLMLDNMLGRNKHQETANVQPVLAAHQDEHWDCLGVDAFHQIPAESDFFDNDDRLQSIVEDMGSGLAIIDFAGNFQFSNRAVEQLLEVVPGTLAMTNVKQFVSEAVFRSLVCGVKKTNEAHANVAFVDITTSGGSSRTLKIQSKPFRNPLGKVTGILSVFSDHSADAIVKHNMVKSLSLLQATFESTSDALLVLDHEQNVVRYNSKFLRMWQISADYLEHTSNIELSRYFESFMVNSKSFIDSQSPNYMDPDLVSTDLIEFVDGRRIDVFSQPQKVDGETVGRVWRFKDVTIQRKTEKALNDSLLRLKAIVDNMKGVLFSCEQDENWTMRYVSPGVEELSGYRPSDFVFNQVRSFGSIIHPDDRPWINGEIGKALAQAETYTVEFRIIAADGLVKWVWARGRAGTAVAGKAVLEGFISDITDRKTAERQLMLAKAQFEESDRLKTAFLHNISHEIRTPINAIMGFAKLLENEALALEKRNRFNKIVLDSASQLVGIIDDIVDLASIEANQVKVKNGPVAVSAHLKGLHALYLPKSREKGLLLECIIDRDVEDLVLLTDKTKMVQVLTNLLNNAFKFTTEGSIIFGAQLLGHGIRFFVRDTGIGIEADMQEQVFERFAQANRQLSESYGGMGLGLAICKAYVGLMDGIIGVDSIPGQGSEFHFSLPLRRVADDVTVEEIDGVLGVADKDLLVMVAEDEDTNYLLMSEMLKLMEVRVIRASNGLEAVDICRKNPKINLVFMDLKMPEMGGVEAAREIKRFAPAIPIVALTAYAFNHTKNQVMEAGCVDFATKPISMKELRELMGRHMR